MEEKTFRTKTGYCHVLSDRILFTNDGVITEAPMGPAASQLSRILTVYTIVSLALIYSAFDIYRKGNVFLPVLLSIFAMLLIYGVIKSINYSSTMVIPRKDILKAEFHKGVPGLTRSRFIVTFNENGKVRKRMILLPGSFDDGAIETERARTIMAGEGLLL